MHRIRLIKREALGKINATKAAELAEKPVGNITSPEYMDVLKMVANLEKKRVPHRVAHRKWAGLVPADG